MLRDSRPLWRCITRTIKSKCALSNFVQLQYQLIEYELRVIHMYQMSTTFCYNGASSQVGGCDAHQTLTVFLPEGHHIGGCHYILQTIFLDLLAIKTFDFTRKKLTSFNWSAKTSGSCTRTVTRGVFGFGP